VPRQNRVTPFNEIIAHPSRASRLMGNRGCLHNDDGNIVRHSRSTAWISCTTTWPGVRRTLMAPGSYTELFFLDDPTALAVGHRPCGSCRHAALVAFKKAWGLWSGSAGVPRTAEIDRALATERGRLWQEDAANLPKGTMIEDPRDPGVALMRVPGGFLRWTFDGYAETPPVVGQVWVITPSAIVRTLATGYAAELHPSANCDGLIAVTR
jgi:hypothetical protein